MFLDQNISNPGSVIIKLRRYNAISSHFRWAKVEESQGGGDDTAANSIRLFCKTRNNIQVGSISSYDGVWGDWTGRVDCLDESIDTYFLTRFRLQVEEPQGSWSDDTAVNNMDMECTLVV